MIDFYNAFHRFAAKIKLAIRNSLGSTVFVAKAVAIFVMFPISRFGIRFLVIPMTYFRQSNFIVLPDKNSINNPAEKLIDSSSENITLVFGGNIAHIDLWFDYFRNHFVLDNVFGVIKGTKFVMPSYYDLTNNWTQKKIQEWIANKIIEIEEKCKGKVVNVYGHSMGGFFASEAYAYLQRTMSEARKAELEANGFNKLILDRTFSTLAPLVSHFLNISMRSAVFLLKKLNCNLVNALFDDKTEYPDEKILNPKNLTFVEDVDDFTIAAKFQISFYWRKKMQEKEQNECLTDDEKKTRYFFLKSELEAHLVGYNSYGTTLEQIDINGNPLSSEHLS